MQWIMHMIIKSYAYDIACCHMEYWRTCAYFSNQFKQKMLSLTIFPEIYFASIVKRTTHSISWNWVWRSVNLMHEWITAILWMCQIVASLDFLTCLSNSFFPKRTVLFFIIIFSVAILSVKHSIDFSTKLLFVIFFVIFSVIFLISSYFCYVTLP